MYWETLLVRLGHRAKRFHFEARRRDAVSPASTNPFQKYLSSKLDITKKTPTFVSSKHYIMSNKMDTKMENWKSKTMKNTMRLAFWTVCWTSSMALASFGPKEIWEGNTILTVIAVLINLGCGIRIICAHISHLKDLDELQKKIQLEAMGIALGVGIVGGLSYSLLDITNLISNDAEISFLVILISLTYLTGLLVGQKRYK
jgi:hypothetical protein